MNKHIYNILVVEDNPADVDLLRMALSAAELDCNLTVIDDGGDALALVRQHMDGNEVPDLAILDLNLPKCDGLEVLEAMRSNPQLTEVPVAILSSSSSPRERLRMQAFRVGRYITKPPDVDEFLRIGSIFKELLAETAC